MAAIHDETADAAIGNITSSNSANVFLGLGLPWIIAAGYFYNRVSSLNRATGRFPARKRLEHHSKK
eukprot:scaffold20905_cov15-Tisochrysis_lutea.AAC.1